MSDALDALQKTVDDTCALIDSLRAEICQNKIDLEEYRRDVEALTAERDRLKAALARLRDCDWVITLPDRMDAVREIARKALEAEE